MSDTDLGVQLESIRIHRVRHLVIFLEVPLQINSPVELDGLRQSPIGVPIRTQLDFPKLRNLIKEQLVSKFIRRSSTDSAEE